MRYFLLLMTGLLLSGVWGCSGSDKPKLVMVTNATFRPYEFVSGQKIDGIDPAIVREIADALGYELEIQDMSFDSLIAAVQSGRADIAAAGITVTEERKKQVLFTDSYVTAEQLIVVRRDAPYQRVADLKKAVIGVQHGTTGDLYVTKNICEPERYAHAPLVISALLAGKVDAAVLDSEPARVFVQQKAADLRLLTVPLTSEEYAFAIGKHNPDLLVRVNRELRRLKQEGRLDSIIRHYRELCEVEAEQDVVGGHRSMMAHLRDSLYVNFVKDRRYIYLWNGFLVTVCVTFFAVLLGIAIGFVVAVIRSTADQTGRWKAADWCCRVYLTVIRGTPAVVQLLIIYFVIFGAVDVNKICVAIVAFGINSGAYVAEIIRGGIMSIDRGQMEAGQSLGLTYSQTMRMVILPQALKNVLPALGNEGIVLLKETSVSGYIALQDLTKGGDIIRSQTYDAFLPLMAVALIYLAVVMLLTRLLGILEKRLKRNE